MSDRFFNDTEHAYECGLQDGLARCKAERELLREMAAEFVDVQKTIKALHGPSAWTIYERSAPEMVRIRAIIAKAEEMLK